MAHFDLPLVELQRYRSSVVAPHDFDEFWQGTLAEARAHRSPTTCTVMPTALTELTVHDVRFSGFAGHRIAGWLITPRRAEGPLATVVSYLGYGGGRGLPESWTQVAAAGMAQLVVDSRGQGSGYRTGDTPDPGVSGPHSGGVMTLGIDDPHDYYYRRLFTDAVLALDALDELPGLDPHRVLVQGGSQGGAIALAVAGLSDRPLAASIDVPFLCDIPRAIRLVDTAPYSEIARYLRAHRGAIERVERTLSYVDGVVFAERARASALFSVGLMDQICPPSTVYAAYNAYAGEKTIEVYPFNGHENGEEFQARTMLQFAAGRLRGEAGAIGEA
jgi:cephalosporin-C deacetylase